MPVDAAYTPEPAFAALGPEFSDAAAPAAFPRLTPRFWNAPAAASVGLADLTDEERARHFGRFEPLPGQPGQPGPRAMRYHGHQFQTYNPDLGDGRGFLFAQLRETGGAGQLLDLGTKGSGVTPYSRDGDGRLTLKGAVREVLATTMLQALGVPTSRTFAIYETHEDLVRGDEPSPTRSAVLTRLSWSHVRFGTFQRHAYFERADLISMLIDHVIALYYPELAAVEGPARAPALLEAVAGRTARMVAGWMAAGFVHGVLNTDNMNINGESFDYGPWRFLPHDAPGFTAAYFDRSGLYAFGRQPAAVFWNLQQLAACLTLVSDDRAALAAALNTYGPAYRRELAAAVLGRLGVGSLGAEADALTVQAAFAALAEGAPALGWEAFFFDWFGGQASGTRALEGPRAALYRQTEAQAFAARLLDHPPVRPERLASPVFAAPEPETMLIDEVEALWASIAEGDEWDPLKAKLARVEAAGLAYGLPGTG